MSPVFDQPCPHRKCVNINCPFRHDKGVKKVERHVHRRGQSQVKPSNGTALPTHAPSTAQPVQSSDTRVAPKVTKRTPRLAEAGTPYTHSAAVDKVLVTDICPHDSECKNIHCPFKHRQSCPHGGKCKNINCPFSHAAPAQRAKRQRRRHSHRHPSSHGTARPITLQARIKALALARLKGGTGSSRFDIPCPYARGTCANINCPFQHPIAGGTKSSQQSGQLSVLSPLLRRRQRTLRAQKRRSLKLSRLADGSYARTDTIRDPEQDKKDKKKKQEEEKQGDGKRRQGVFSRAMSVLALRAQSGAPSPTSTRLSTGKRIIIAGQSFRSVDNGKRLVPNTAKSGEGKSDLDPTASKPAFIPSQVVVNGATYKRAKAGDGGVELVRAGIVSKRAVAQRILLNRRKLRGGRGRTGASRHLTLIRDQRESEDCLFYTRFGRCNQAEACPYKHDPDKVAICRLFLQGNCSIDDCPFQHRLVEGQVPVCAHFLRGTCARENCRYSHVRVNPDAEVCPSFQDKGFCALGENCPRRHPATCEVYLSSGKCPRGKRCHLLHPKRLRRGRDSGKNDRNKKGEAASVESPPRQAVIEQQRADQNYDAMRRRLGLTPRMGAQAGPGDRDASGDVSKRKRKRRKRSRGESASSYESNSDDSSSGDHKSDAVTSIADALTGALDPQDRRKRPRPSFV